MGRPGYISIYVDDKTNQMFDKFIKLKGLTKSDALAEMMEIYMLCQDEELYMNLKKEALGLEQAKQAVLARSDNSAVNDFIFMKLGYSFDVEGNQMGGEETIDAHIRNCNENGLGYTWFATDSLTWGMAKKKVAYYNNLVQSGETVQMLFASGYNDNNEIAYAADVLEIASNRDTIPCPGEGGTEPEEFAGQKAKIWIKITKIREEHNLKAAMMKVRSTDSNLKQVITTSQFHFGYVYLPDEEDGER